MQRPAIIAEIGTLLPDLQLDAKELRIFAMRGRFIWQPTHALHLNLCFRKHLDFKFATVCCKSE